MEDSFVKGYARSYAANVIAISLIGGIFVAGIASISPVLGLLAAVGLFVIIVYLMFNTIADMCEEIIEIKYEQMEFTATQELTDNDAQIDDDENEDIDNIINDIDISDFQYEKKEESKYITLPNQGLNVYLVDDGEREAEFVVRNNKIEPSTNVYQRKYGTKWVQVAQDFLNSKLDYN